MSVLWLLLVAQPAFAGSSGRIDEIPLEDLLNGDTTATARVAMSPRKTPGIVTVLTRDDIRRSGARDLLGLLERMPGVQVALDRRGIVGLGIRGLWSQNGGVLVLVDGEPMTEPMFGTTPLGGRISVEQIERVELVRGGAALEHGSVAGMAVINVVSRAHGGPEGSQVHTELCAQPGTVTCGMLGLSHTYQRDTTRIAVNASIGEHRQNTGIYEDYWGGKIDLSRTNKNDVRNLSLSANLGEWSFRLGTSRLRRTQQDGDHSILDKPVAIGFRRAFANASRTLHLGRKVDLRTEAGVRFDSPWRTYKLKDVHHEMYYARWLVRTRAQAHMKVEASRKLVLRLGAGGGWHVLWSNPDWQRLPNGKGHAHFGTSHAYVDTQWHDRVMTAQWATRMDHGALGTTVSSKIALTAAGDVMHAKVLASNNFRQPTYEHFLRQLELNQENIFSGEVEIGARVSRTVAWRSSGNVTALVDPLLRVYQHDPYAHHNDENTYINGETVYSLGGTTEVVLRTERVRLALDHAWHHALAPPSGARAPGHPARTIAFAPQTLSVRAQLSPLQRLWITPSVRILGPRTVFDAMNRGRPITHDLPASGIIDAAIRSEGLGVEGLDVTLELHDLLNSNPSYYQAYGGNHAPLPGKGREVALRAAWSW